MTLRLPYVNRAHKQLENEDNGQGGVDTALEKFDFSGIGDLQALGRYHFYRDDTSSAGVRFGLKLPTGSIHKHNSEEDAERALQPGTGSVDSLMGAYYNKRVDHLSWFVQGMWQQTVHERDDFRPGRKLSLDTGLSYSATPELNLMLQLNLQHRAKDRGSNAETRDSGLYSASLSPGLSYRIKSGTQVYAFVQKPIYQYVNGEQLTADWSLAVGLTTQF